LNNDAKSPLVCFFLPLPELILDVGAVTDRARVLPCDVKLDLGAATIATIGGDAVAEVEDVILIPSDDGDQGRNTLRHDRECKSQMRSVPSFDPLASSAVPPLEIDARFDGSINAKEVTAFT
jgi:hypothetical protein